MDIDKIQSFDWLDQIIDFYYLYRRNIYWGDQDLLNIYFSYNPGL